MHKHADRLGIWRDMYHGRYIAIFRRYGRWHVYLDHVFQHNVLFGKSEEAVDWLTECIDQSVAGRPN